MATAGKAVVLASGKRGVLAGGKAAVFDAAGECAACCPYCRCTSSQPDAEVFVSGTCSGAYEAICRGAAGVYEYSHHERFEDECNYFWTKGNYTLQGKAAADTLSNFWYVSIFYDPTGLLFIKSADVEVLCFLGTWAGAVILNPWTLCTNCVATVDFGGVL